MPDENLSASERGPFEAPLPRAARTPEETGIPFLFLVELVCKILFLRGQMYLTELALHIKLPVSVVDKVLVFIRAEKLCETTRRGTSGTDADTCLSLTEMGRSRASQYMLQNAYAGPAPVTLEAYTAQVRMQSVAGMSITSADMNKEFGDLVVDPEVLGKLGAAMNSGRAILIHGPAGSGKTYLAERMRGLLQGTVLVPYAIMVDREVLPFYDNLVHEAVATPALPPSGIERPVPADTRWLRVKRPAVLVGGELTLPMLDVQFDQGTRMYHAPTHLKANNGIFVIDDLGRQRCSAMELMNRWIVPMDRGVDFLSLHTGYKFPVPFDMIIVFSSNFAPDTLSDGAFLRRLGYKIHVGAVTTEQYQAIFRGVCERLDIAFDDAAFSHLLALHASEKRALLACYPRDLLAQVCDVARYYQRAPKLSAVVLTWAWQNYFTASAAEAPKPVLATVGGMFYERRNRASPEE
jgi:predicted ATPase with chaperone activity